MGDIREHDSVLLVAAVTSQFSESFDWARRRCEAVWGPVALASPRFAFDMTQYYADAMGRELKKELLAFDRQIDPANLADAKIASNQLEDELVQSREWSVERPVNIDPGYLTEAKLVLATTKDRDHRIYVGKGIFAEVTLFFRGGAWQSSRWTYPDFQQSEYHEFFDRCRELLRNRIRNQ